MKPLIVLFSLLCLAGCTTPLAEINYRGPLLAEQINAFEVAESFAGALEKETDLKIIDRSKRTGVARSDASASVHLRTPRSSAVWVMVTAYVSERSIVASVGGDIASPLAKELAVACERAHSRLYPGTAFVQFQRNRGILGP
jgi:hypothetical protein